MTGKGRGWGDREEDVQGRESWVAVISGIVLSLLIGEAEENLGCWLEWW